MSLTATDRRELLEALAALSDGVITPVQLETVRELVKTEPEACSLYTDHMALDALLHWSIDKTGCIESDSPPQSICDDLIASSRPVDSPKVRASHSRLRSSSRWVAIAASVLLVGYFVSIVGLLIFDRFRPPRQIANEVEQDGQTLATLRRSDNSEWGEATFANTKPDAIAAKRLHVRTGFAELQFGDGARVLIQGPAEFEVHSASRGYLLSGRLTAEVSREAIGFTIETPTAHVVDLGTTFGVEVDALGKTEVHTFVGLVEVSKTRSASPQDSAIVHRVHAGQAVRVNATTNVEQVNIDANRFARVEIARDKKAETPASAAAAEQANRTASDYGKLILDAKPTFYFSMDRVQNGRITSLGSARLPASLHSSDKDSTWLAKGRVNHALKLRGQDKRDCLLVPDYPPSRSGKLSASVWVLASSTPTDGSIAKNWGSTEQPSGQFHLGFEQDTGILEVEIRQQDRSKVSLAESGGVRFSTGNWQHVAFVADGRQLRLFRNGELVGQMPCGAVLVDPEILVLGIGVKPNGVDVRPDQDHPGYWHGMIDELAVFDYPLTDEQIKRFASPPSQLP